MFSNLLILLDYQSSTLFYSSVQHHCFATPYTITILPPLLQLHYPLCYSYTTLSATTIYPLCYSYTTLSATAILPSLLQLSTLSATAILPSLLQLSTLSATAILPSLLQLYCPLHSYCASPHCTIPCTTAVKLLYSHY